jgi:diadenosine tetraphosphate (Ap4A) HIT family hydrolase
MRTTHCITCDVTTNHPELVVWHDALVVVNHYLDESDLRSGWFVVSPKRHITRWFDLTDAELQAIATTTRAMDAALTAETGSKRTMVASLGWLTHDHLHIHCVPTFDEEVTLGFENFNGSWRGVARPARQVCQGVEDRLAATLNDPPNTAAPL